MKLSIITINYNNAIGLRKTMESVFAQTYRDFEYIVVDGASTDGSVDVIREYEQKRLSFPFTWVSEKDSGIYNAMNKGIEIASGLRVVDPFNRSELVEDKNKGVRVAKGEYVLMLNSGDYLVDEHVIERIIPELDGTDIVQGNTIREHNGKEYVARGYGKSNINYIDVQQGHFLHQASFCRRDLFERYGYFDESYKIDGDTVFYIRCLGNGNATFRYVDQHIAYFEPGGASDGTNAQWEKQRAIEYRRWSTEEFSKRQWDTCIEYDKKGRLYDKLHRHHWAWNITMLIAKIIDKIENKYENNRK